MKTEESNTDYTLFYMEVIINVFISVFITLIFIITYIPKDLGSAEWGCIEWDEIPINRFDVGCSMGNNGWNFYNISEIDTIDTFKNCIGYGTKDLGRGNFYYEQRKEKICTKEALVRTPK